MRHSELMEARPVTQPLDGRASALIRKRKLVGFISHDGRRMAKLEDTKAILVRRKKDEPGHRWQPAYSDTYQSVEEARDQAWRWVNNEPVQPAVRPMVQYQWRV